MKIDLIGTEPAIIVGLMSGTSADAIDAAVVEIQDLDGVPDWRLVGHTVRPWSPELRAEILNACRADAPLRETGVLNFRLGEEFAAAAISALEAAEIPTNRVTAIASHGQTVWHQPRPLRVAGQDTTATVQIGEAAVIAARTGLPVIADFRAADMAVGGSGAPLAPYADHLLFADAAETRAVQNLGGIGNVTYLPPIGQAGIIAFDTGPANMVMDWLVARLTDGAQTCDLDGRFASAGQPDATLLNELLQHPFFRESPLKTTGREEFGEHFAAEVLRKGQRLSPQDIMATALALTVESVADAYARHLTPRGPIDRVILGGGGTRNPALVKALRSRLAPMTVQTHSDFGLPDEAKEAVAFALLGYQTLRGRCSNVPAATGAKTPAILGKIALPPQAGGR